MTAIERDNPLQFGAVKELVYEAYYSSASVRIAVEGRTGFRARAVLDGIGSAVFDDVLMKLADVAERPKRVREITQSTAEREGSHDVLVIGGGAAGAAVSLGLAEHGLKVLCLEQGDWIDRANVPKQHLDWEVRLRNEWSADPNRRKWKSDYSVLSVGKTPVRPSLFNAVGGSTLGFGGMYWRLLPSDFRTKSLDGFGVDWPITYEDLAPYYRKNELVLGISGMSGDPTAPDREEMPFPPPTLGKIGRIWADGSRSWAGTGGRRTVRPRRERTTAARSVSAEASVTPGVPAKRSPRSTSRIGLER